MKKLMIMMAALMFTTTGAIAQETCIDTTPCQVKKMPHKQMDPTAKMARELDLTPEQMVKVRELNAKYPEIARHPGHMNHPHHKGMKNFKNNKDLKKFDSEKMKGGKMHKKDPAKMKEVKAKYDKELKNILTKKQFKKYNELEEKKMQFRDQRPPMEPKN